MGRGAIICMARGAIICVGRRAIISTGRRAIICMGRGAIICMGRGAIICMGTNDKRLNFHVAGVPIVELGQYILFLSKISSTALRTPHPTIQRILGFFYPGIKLMRHESKHLTPPSAEIKNEWNCTFAPPYAFMA